MSFYCHIYCNTVFDVMMWGWGHRLMPSLALFGKRDKSAWKRNWASVLLCDLAEASHVVEAATPLLRVYERQLAQGLESVYFVCACASPSLPSPRSCVQGLRVCACQCVCTHVGDRAPHCSRQTTLGMPEPLGTENAIPGIKGSWHERRFNCALHRGLLRGTECPFELQPYHEPRDRQI